MYGGRRDQQGRMLQPDWFDRVPAQTENTLKLPAWVTARAGRFFPLNELRHRNRPTIFFSRDA
jgi:hypothetical protein